MYEKNQILQINITDISHDGEGIGKTDGFTWFVKDAIPGDKVEASVMKTKKTYGYARLQKVIVPSKDRTEPRCKKARACGGCTLQAMSYPAQLEFKRNKVKNNLERIGGFRLEETGVEVEPVIGMDDPWRYRNKAIIPIGYDKDGRVVAGFYAAHSHNIIECEDCLLGSEENKDIIKKVKGIYADDITHVLIRKGLRTGEHMVCAVSNHENNAVLSGRITPILGSPEYIEDYIGDLKFRISPRSFFQVNPIQVEKLYGKAVEFAELTGKEVVWDLYCGIGTISLALAQQAGRVYGVEIIEQAIEDAKQNARINGINNAEFFVGKAEEVTLRDEFTGSNPDVVVVDPPRKGCDKVCLDTILRMNPKRIVYVSCDSATLARDLRILCDGGYELKKVQPVDMFPQTVHVECVAQIQRIHP